MEPFKYELCVLSDGNTRYKRFMFLECYLKAKTCGINYVVHVSSSSFIVWTPKAF